MSCNEICWKCFKVFFFCERLQKRPFELRSKIPEFCRALCKQLHSFGSHLSGEDYIALDEGTSNDVIVKLSFKTGLSLWAVTDEAASVLLPQLEIENVAEFNGSWNFLNFSFSWKEDVRCCNFGIQFTENKLWSFVVLLCVLFGLSLLWNTNWLWKEAKTVRILRHCVEK